MVRERSRADGAALAALGLVSFLVIFVINRLQRWARAQEQAY